MALSPGVLLALGALVCWSFGDFYIQKATRKLGVGEALFFIGMFGGVILVPFVIHDLSFLVFGSVAKLFLVLVVIDLISAITDFHALKEGKIAVVEPIISFELPLTVMLSLWLAGEFISGLQMILITVIFIGILLAVTIHPSHLHYHRRLFEKGVLWAAGSAFAMGIANTLTGIGSRVTSPLLTIWVTFLSLGLLSGLYLWRQGKIRKLVRVFKKYPQIIWAESVLDTVGWIFFALSTTRIPIGITTSISEGYIALTVLLGIFLNRERLKKHQMIGVAVTLCAVLLLSIITSRN